MNNYANAVCKSVHYHIRALRHIPSSVSEDMAKMVACALVGSRLDYANSSIWNHSEKHLQTPISTEPPRPCCYKFSSILQSTYSPPAAPLAPIKHSFDFKIANITFRTLHCSQPAYLRSSLHACHSTRSLRLSNTNLVSAPFVRTSFGSRSFSVAAPKIWNSLPLSLHT